MTKAATTVVPRAAPALPTQTPAGLGKAAIAGVLWEGYSNFTP
jgi:hypothetical protein